MTGSTGQHWLYEWIDEYEIGTKQSVQSAIQNGRVVERLIEIVTKAQSDEIDPAVPMVGSVVGGNGLELKPSVSSCNAFECRTVAADRELGQVLHYFDCVIVEGPEATGYLSLLSNLEYPSRNDVVAWDIEQDVRLLNHIRDAGIANYIYFCRKPKRFCTKHFTIHMQDIGLDSYATPESITRLTSGIAKQARMRVEAAPSGSYRCHIEHPLFSDMEPLIWTGAKKPTKKAIIRSIIAADLSGRVGDTFLAKTLKAPLVSLTQTGFFPPSPTGRATPAIEEVAAHLSLPVLTNLTTAELVKLREAEFEHFERFRKALTNAISETIEQHGSDSPARIAATVERNLIQPEFRELQRKLDASGRSLFRKSTVALTAASAAVAIGAITAMPLIIAAGVAAAATPLPQVFKFFDEKQEVELSDMYFLWKAHKIHR